MSASLSRRIAFPSLLIGALALAGTGHAQTISGQPFHSLSTDALPALTSELSVGAEWRGDSYVVSPVMNEHGSGEILRAPIVTWRLGFGRADLVFSAPLEEFWHRDNAAAGEDDTENGFGDIEFWAKIAAVHDNERHPGLAFAIGTKVPNADNELGIGSNEADVFASVLVSETWGPSSFAFNVGLGILGDPAKESTQQDVLVASIAGVHGRRHAFAWEAWGQGLGQPERDLDEATVAAGYLYRSGQFTFHAAALHGLVSNSGGLGLRTSMTWRLGRSR